MTKKKKTRRTRKIRRQLMMWPTLSANRLLGGRRNIGSRSKSLSIEPSFVDSNCFLYFVFSHDFKKSERTLKDHSSSFKEIKKWLFFFRLYDGVRWKGRSPRFLPVQEQTGARESFQNTQHFWDYPDRRFFILWLNIRARWVSFF